MSYLLKNIILNSLALKYHGYQLYLSIYYAFYYIDVFYHHPAINDTYSLLNNILMVYPKN